MEASEVSSLAQGLRIVRIVTDREKWGRSLFGVTQIATELGMDRSRVSRLTQELCDLSLLERVDRGPFRAGPAFFSLAASLNMGWVSASRMELQRITAGLGLKGRVSVRDGARVILIRASSDHGLSIGMTQPGMITPVWCTGSGRALLWDHSDTELQELLADVEFIGVGGPRAAHSTAEVAVLMERDRTEGFIRAAEEFEHGVHELAVPVRDPAGHIVASLCVFGEQHEIDGRLQLIRAAIEGSVQRLAAAAGSGIP